MEKLTNIIEAVLFASGNAVPTDILREKLNITKAELDSAIHSLEKKYTGLSGIRFLNFNHKLQFATNPDYKEEVASVLTPIREKEFTRTILECAAIIAYKQPITKTEVDEIRGVSSEYAINTLLQLEMIEATGRRESIGHPFEYSTTDNFLKRFKLRSLKELPDYDDLMQKIAEINAFNEKAQAEEGDYLYQKDVYDPNSDNNDENKPSGIDIPDFLKNIEDELIKIQ